MNFLRRMSDVQSQFRRRHPQYWLDRLVDEYLRQRRLTVRDLDGLGISEISGQVLAILRNDFLGKELVVPGLNIVTDKGDKYYAQMICSESPTDDFDGTNSGLRLGTGVTSPTKSSGDVTTENSAGRHALDATYEKTNDGDSDNTGAGVDIVSWRYSYLTSEGNITNIAEGAIVDNRTTPTGALSHFLFAAAFTKTSSDTLKVFVNHTQNGV